MGLVSTLVIMILRTIFFTTNEPQLTLDNNRCCNRVLRLTESADKNCFYFNIIEPHHATFYLVDTYYSRRNYY